MPKSKEQFEQIRNERIKNILKSATTLFALKGYDAVNLDEVTKVAKCSHGLLYHYFKGKEELYQAVLEQVVYPECKKMISGVKWDQKAKYIVHDLLDSVLNVIKSNNDEQIRTLYLLLNIHLQKNLPIVKKNEKGRTMILASLEEIVARGIKEGDFKEFDPFELTISVLSLLKGLSFTRIHIGYKRFTCPHIEIIMGLLLK